MKGLRTPFSEVGAEFARRWVQRRGDAVQRYGRILENFGSGRLNAGAALQEWARLVTDETARYAEETVELGAAYLRVLGAGFGNAPSTSGAASSEPSPARFDLDLTGPLGGEVTRTFLLDNKQAVSAEISFLTSSFTGPVGTRPFHAAVDFVPARFTLRPNEEQSVTLRLALDPNLFAAGQRYDGRIIVQGHDSLEIGLHILVAAADS
jgi:hypothetical protein